MSNVKYTSSGIIRNADKPRTGIISQNSLSSYFLDEFITDGINISYETWFEDRRQELTDEGLTPEEVDSKMDGEPDFYESDNDTFLLGAWRKIPEGTIDYLNGRRYEIDRSGKSGNYAAMYSSYSGNVSVEWSQTTKVCSNTSPCYVMADGSGPCGNLDSDGDTVIAYALPDDCLFKEGN